MVCVCYCVLVVRGQLSGVASLFPSLHGFQGPNSGPQVYMASTFTTWPILPVSRFGFFRFLRQGLVHPRLTSWPSCLYFSSAETRGSDAQLSSSIGNFQRWVQVQGCISVGFAPVSLRICCTSTPGMSPDCASGLPLHPPAQAQLLAWMESRRLRIVHGKPCFSPWENDVNILRSLAAGHQWPCPQSREKRSFEFPSVRGTCQYDSDISPNKGISLWWR